MHDKGHLDRLGQQVYAAYPYHFTGGAGTSVLSPGERGFSDS